MADRRGRRLVLRPTPGLSATAPCGMWISINDADYVLFEADTSALHAEHIILHELCHMLSDHSLGPGFDPSLLGRLLPDLDPAIIHRVLGRVSYTTEQEQEAELLASMIRARADAPAPPPPPGGGRLLGQLADAFSYQRW